MRITADVIDEEPCPSIWPNEYEQMPEENNKNIKVVVQSSLRSKDDKPYHVKFDRMLRKFQKLYVSDFHSAVDSTDTPEQVQSSLIYGYYYPHMKGKMVRNANMAEDTKETRKEMEINLSDSIETKNASEGASDIPSECLTVYLEAMKKEITREVTQNVMQQLVSSCDFFNDTDDTFAELDEVVHKGVFCDHCDRHIYGVRYKCGNCVDYDLCELCESIPKVHDVNHIFLKIRSPLPTPAKTKRRRKKLVKPHTHRDVSCEYPHLYLGRPLERRKMNAEFLCDVTISDGAVVKPEVTFMKSWKVVNSGLRPWTRSTTVKLLSGSEDMKPHKNQVVTPMLLPGEQGIVSVMFTSPKVPGFYHSYWGFYHNDEIFGHRIWCSIEVRENVEDELQDNAQRKVDAENCQENTRDDKVIQFTDALTAVHEVQERGEFVSRKLASTSHTTTPNNTPFDLTPPKSPEPQDTVTKDIKMNLVVENIGSSSNKEAHKQSESTGDISCVKEDGSGYISISSSESDTDFVVIPMPSCFTLEETVPISESCESDTVKCSISSDLPTNSQVLNEKEQDELHLVQQINVDQVHNTNFGLDTTPSERVSQETGAPEVAENISIETVVVINNGDDAEENNKTSATANLTIVASNTDIDAGGADEPTNTLSVADVDNVTACEENKEKNLPVETVPKLLASDNSSVPTAAAQMDKEGEKTIQVLPEGLVTGALRSAALVYNAARSVILNVQVKNDQNPGVEKVNPVESPTHHTLQSVHIPTMNPMAQLIEMGFCNRSRNEQLLRKYSGDVAVVVAALVNMNDNDWYASRHSPETLAFD